MQAYPFSAIVGQQAVKQALLLAMVDSRLGGVLISGARGTAKSTLVRGIAALQAEQPLVTLPLSTTEEMLVGSLDVSSALKQGDINFSPGLLARAHGGVLYVDEVNLLADHLVDTLLDVAASGINRVERDSISHQHPAQFVLLGTMNPDEGELRPQLLDRFGLMVQMNSEFSVEQRQEITQRRLAYDDDADGFCATYQAATAQLIEQISNARARLRDVLLPPDIQHAIAEHCLAAQVDGLRADITLHRAARAHAAWRGSSVVDTSDLLAVLDMVLLHRRQTATSATPPSSPPSTPPAQNSNGGADDSRPDDRSNTPQDGANQTSPQDAQPANQQGSGIVGSWGQNQRKQSVASNVLELPDWLTKPSQTAQLSSASRTKHQATPAQPLSNPKGRQTSLVSGSEVGKSSTIHWPATLTSPLNRRLRQHLKPLTELLYRQPRPTSNELELVMLDVSASTLSGAGLSKAKGMLQSLSGHCYRQRKRLALIVFANGRSDVLLMPQRAPKNLSKLLDGLLAGGGTPLFAACQQAAQLLDPRRYQWACANLWLLTDGRVKLASAEVTAIGEMLGLPSARSQTSPLPATRLTVVDIETSRVKLGLGKLLAQSLHADYHVLPA